MLELFHLKYRTLVCVLFVLYMYVTSLYEHFSYNDNRMDQGQNYLGSALFLKKNIYCSSD